MIRFGRSLRWTNDYDFEVNFSKKIGIDFHQIWYSPSTGISANGLLEPKEKDIAKKKFPAIIHALLDISEFNTINIQHISEITEIIGINEIIIHPICRKNVISDDTVKELSEKLNFMNRLVQKFNHTLFIENNAKMDPINYLVNDLKYIFEKNEALEFLLDIAHIDDYNHLYELINVKMPKKIHVSDKRFCFAHEHLSLGKGDLNLTLIFNFLKDKNFSGDIIMEMIDTDEQIEHSLNIIKNFFDT
jgi:sugar phosphate isomerase/epimerase